MYIDKKNAKRLIIFIEYSEIIKKYGNCRDCDDLKKRCIYIIRCAYKDGYIIGYDEDNDNYYIHLR